MRAAIAGLVVGASALAACGAKSALELGGTMGAGGSTSASTAASTATHGSSVTASSSSGPPPTCSRWRPVGDAVAISTKSSDSILTSAIVDGDAALVAYTNDNDPSPDPTWHVARASFDAQVLSDSPVLTRRSSLIAFGGLSLASDDGKRGGFAWDEVDGCRFVPLAPSGVPAGGVVTVTSNGCTWPRATVDGYAVYTSPPYAYTPRQLAFVDPNGVPASSVDVLPADGFDTGIAHAFFPDGTTMAVARGDGPVELETVSSQGWVVARMAYLLGQSNTRAAMAAAPGNTAIVAFSIDPSGGDLSTQTIGSSFQMGALTSVQASGPAIYDLALASLDDGALVAWTSQDAGTISLARLDAAAALVPGSVVASSPVQFPSQLRVVTQGDRGLLVFEGEQAGPMQVFVMPISCADD